MSGLTEWRMEEKNTLHAMILGLAMGLGTGNLSWPDSRSVQPPLKNMRKNMKKGTKVRITNQMDMCPPPINLLGASLELEYTLLSTVYA